MDRYLEIKDKVKDVIRNDDENLSSINVELVFHDFSIVHEPRPLSSIN